MIGARAPCRHALRDRLRREELVIEIERECAPPVIRLHLGHVVPVVLAGIVDENVDTAVIAFDPGQRLAERRDVSDIAGVEGGSRCACQRIPRLLRDIDEGHPCALRHESLHHLLADSGRAARDDDGAVLKGAVLDGCVVERHRNAASNGRIETAFGQARHIDPHGEQASRMRKGRQLIPGTAGAGGRHVKGLQVGPAEADHGGAPGRNGIFRQEASIRRVALDPSALEQSRPVAAFRIHRRAVGTPAIGFGGLEGARTRSCPSPLRSRDRRHSARP